MLASLLFPYDNDAPSLIDGWLSELQAENCITRYRVNGNQYIEVRNWLSHQKIDKPSKSKIEPFANGIEDSPNPRERSSEDRDQGPRTGTKDREGNGKDYCAADAAASDEPSGPSEDEELHDWMLWWNTLASESLVPAGVKVDEPSEGVLAGWKRVRRKDRTGARLRQLLADRDAIEREIRDSKFCRAGWFTLGKLFGGKNRDGALVLQQLVDGAYRNGAIRGDDPRGNQETLSRYLEGMNGDGIDEAAGSRS